MTSYLRRFALQSLTLPGLDYRCVMLHSTCCGRIGLHAMCSKLGMQRALPRSGMPWASLQVTTSTIVKLLLPLTTHQLPGTSRLPDNDSKPRLWCCREAALTAAACAPDGQSAITGDQGGTLRVWRRKRRSLTAQNHAGWACTAKAAASGGSSAVPLHA